MDNNAAINKTGRGYDWVTFSIYLSLVGIGWLMIYTVGHKSDGYPADLSDFMKTTVGKQTVWIGVSTLLVLIIAVLDFKFWRTFAFLIYAFFMFFLLIVPFVAHEINGARSWFSIGGFGFQPAEFQNLEHLWH